MLEILAFVILVFAIPYFAFKEIETIKWIKKRKCQTIPQKEFKSILDEAQEKTCVSTQKINEDLIGIYISLQSLQQRFRQKINQEQFREIIDNPEKIKTLLKTI